MIDKNRLEKSIVNVYGGRNFEGSRSWGMGFVTLDGYVITAAHCIRTYPDEVWDQTGPIPVELKSFSGRKTVTAFAVGLERCLDLAILSSLGDSSLPQCEEAFDEFISSQESAAISLDEPELGAKFNVHIFTHNKKWITGQTCIYNPRQPGLTVELMDNADQAGPGTSGAPVFDDSGKVVGIVCRGPIGIPEVQVLRLSMALPGWMLLEIQGKHLPDELLKPLCEHFNQASVNESPPA